MKHTLSLFGASLLSITGSAATDNTPNVILILADDMRASAMDIIGKEPVKTPNLDNLAEESTLFTNAHIMGGRRTTQLFNLKEDPWEKNDLGTQKKYRKTIQRLRDKMTEERMNTHDTSSLLG